MVHSLHLIAVSLYCIRMTCLTWKTAALLLMLAVKTCNADKEHVHHAEHDHDIHFPDGAHNVEFDHEAILGSQDANGDFSKLSAHEAKKGLQVLLNKMDVDHNGVISKNEISDWVLNSFRKQDEEESEHKLNDVDVNADGVVSWAEYAEKVFGYSSDELADFAKDTNPEVQSFYSLVKDDSDKFQRADRNHDGSLDNAEYSAFLHPHNYDFMHDLEIDRALADYDRNNDGYVTFDEYIGDSKPGKEQLIVDRENFNSYDLNGDSKLDRLEIAAWVIPDRRSMADEEAEHLVSETDMNHDGQLTTDEILNRHDLWVGSAVTDYGEILKHDAGEL